MLTSRDQVTWKYVQNESFPVTRVVIAILTDVDNYLIFREKNRNTYMRTYRPLLWLVRILLSLDPVSIVSKCLYSVPCRTLRSHFVSLKNSCCLCLFVVCLPLENYIAETVSSPWKNISFRTRTACWSNYWRHICIDVINYNY